MQILSSLGTPHPDVVHQPLGRAAGPWPRRIATFAARAADADAVVVHGSVSAADGYDELVAARWISRRHPDLPVVLANCIWEAGSRAASRLLRAPRPLAVDSPGPHLHRTTRRVISSLAAPNVHCCVLSTDEAAAYPRLWGFAADHVHHTPYWPAGLDALRAAAGPGGDAPYVFAGGDSMRDYRTLLRAAPQIAAPVVVATRLPMPAVLPANVTAGPLPAQRYTELAAAATVAVVPLVARSERSGGQKTYLGAMALGQAVVVPEAPGVRDHVEPGRTGLVPPADDPDALAAAVNRLLADADLRRRLGTQARATVLTRFTRERYGAAVYGLAAELAGTPVGPAVGDRR